MGEFVMPILGADMTSGTLVAWCKQVGDCVARGDIIAEVETEKGLIEVEIFTSGVVDKILIAPGTNVPVGTVLAVIREEGAAAPRRAPMEVPPPAGMPSPAAPAPAPPPTAAEPVGRLRVSPAARKLAAELGVELGTVHATGADGAITREDVERAVTAAQRVAPVVSDRQTRMRQTIAAAMARSKREIPHYYLSTAIDMYRAMTWLTEANLRRPVPERLLYAVLLIKAVALALREVPELNATWVGSQALPSPAIHVGVAISLRDGGLVAPALHDTDRQTVDELMRNFRDLVKRARAGGLRSSELSDPTVTVTSIGEQGVDSVLGIIYPPQVAIVGFGKVAERPWSVGGQILSRPVMTATLSGDHRVTDGHRGGVFLSAVDRLLQEPERL